MKSKSDRPFTAGYRTGQLLQAILLGALLAFSLLRLLSLGAEQQAFRYQGF
jgi:hypothetical protein